jgi:flagellar basal-body rod protein FlgF
MDPIGMTAASGIRARMESLDMLANNLANAATGGYKGDQEFYSLYSAAQAGGDGVVTTMPVVEKPWIDFSQGVLRPTGNSTDLALSGKGLFVVDGPTGPLYTRNGGFRLSAAGDLVTTEGYPVRKVGGGNIRLDPSREFQVTPDGNISQGGKPVAQLEIVEFPKNDAVVKSGNSYFRPTDPKVQPARVTAAEVQQGKIEGSNVVTAQAAVRLVGVMRQFEMLQKAITLSAEMNRKAVEEVARVGG